VLPVGAEIRFAVRFSSRHFAVQLASSYRTTIWLIIQEITSKIPDPSRHFLYVPLRISVYWLQLEVVGIVEKIRYGMRISENRLESTGRDQNS